MPEQISLWIWAGYTVVVDITSPDKKTRKKFVEIAQRLDVKIESHYIMPDLERCKLWNEKRDRKLPEFVLDRQLQKWLTPSIDEGFSKVIEYKPIDRGGVAILAKDGVTNAIKKQNIKDV